MKHLVYGLVDPVTLLVRYVGRSSSGMARPKQHDKPYSLNIKNHKNNWLKGLIATGLTHRIVVLEHTTSDALAECERWWVRYGRLSGWPLTNLTDGGEGSVGWRPSAETRAKIGAANRKRVWTEESRRAAGVASSRVTPEGRAHSLAMMRTPEALLKKNMAIKGLPKTPEHRAKISAAHIARRSNKS